MRLSGHDIWVEALFWVAQGAANALFYILAALLSGTDITSIQTALLVMLQTVLHICQILGAVQIDRSEFLSEAPGTRLLEELGLWYIRMELFIKPLIAVVSVVVQIGFVHVWTRRHGLSVSVQYVWGVAVAGAVANWEGRFGSTGFLTTWRDTKPNCEQLIREFGKANPMGCAVGPGPMKNGGLNVVYNGTVAGGQRAGVVRLTWFS